MKNTLIAALLLFSFTGLTASAFTPAEIRANYYACVKFLKKPKAEQAKIARKSPYSLPQMIGACRLLVKTGLPGVQRAERQRLRGNRGGARQCYTSASGKTICSYGANDAQPLTCGDADQEGLKRCYEPDGTPSDISCYTSTGGGSTSCN